MNTRTCLPFASAVLVCGVLACGGNAPPPQAPSPATPPPPPAPTATVEQDPLGAAPAVTMAPAFQPPIPTVYAAPNGMNVWLLERHSFPVIAVTVLVPTGSSSDPKGEAGLADQSARMLGEGAGKRGALDFARAVDDLGARFNADASYDASHVHLDVSKRNFAAGLHLLGDAVIRPRWDSAEWKRQHDLWVNYLKERASDPEAVAHVVAASVLYGSDHPYGHPLEGLVTSAPHVQLEDAKRFWASAWRPDRATIVVVGDVTKAELDEQIAAAFEGWKSPSTPAPAVVTPPAIAASENARTDAKPKVVFVDRPDAPQAIVDVVRPGVSVSDPRYPALSRANIAIGGSFTSRLMGDLRETHGWTYGAGSQIFALRGGGSVGAGGAFVTDKCVDALKALLADLREFSHGGLTDEEVTKTRLQARSQVVDEYQTVAHTNGVLAGDAALGLGPDFEARSNALSDVADKAKLDELAAAFFDESGASIVIVGPRAKLEGSLVQAGFGPLEFRDAEGFPLKGGK